MGAPARARLREGRVGDDWRPYADGGFATPSGKAELYSAALEEQGLDPLPAHVAAVESPAGDAELAGRYPLQLVTAKWSLHFLNSQYANMPRHLAAEGEMPVDLSSDDAAARGIGDGVMVRVFNDRGSVLATARVGTSVRPGDGGAAVRLVGVEDRRRRLGERPDARQADRPRRWVRLPRRSRRRGAGRSPRVRL